jgi:two-component system response regulator (stage 0 sporulation protein F)
MPHRNFEPTDSPYKKRETADGEPAIRNFGEKPGVLVVDEDHLARALLQMGLERNGFDVWLAPNGYEALHLYEEHADSIDVVLLDFRAPGLDALATLDVLRELDAELRICFMADGSEVRQTQALMRRGASHVTAKPFLLNDLIGVLQKLAQGPAAGPLPAGSAGK